ncbi:MAG: glycosyl hydrolase 115 family protein [Verrucomicrobiota bacterium]
MKRSSPLPCLAALRLGLAAALTAADPFTLAAPGQEVPLVVDADDALGVARAVTDFQQDLERVTGQRPEVMHEAPTSGTAVLIGTVGQSALLEALVAAGKLDLSDLEGRWEAFGQVVVEAPLPGLDRALVIAGSDRRGTMYGLYTLSEEIGVSPWSWWADAPVDQHDTLTVDPTPRVEAPVVKYRGIFLNDEAPALTGWAQEKFGGFNHEFYAHVFELLLRLRANYLWPAMWGSAFNDDDPQNPVLAHHYGIVMGTSHHEPMMRAHDEWRRYGEGAWDYSKNEAKLREFWRTGLERVKDYDKIISMGMRGDGDEAMTEETNTALLERIVDDQREIITEVMDQPVEEVPQLWALYKEVQDYYEHGMRVPDDVILLWCDDNWGNIRRLPTPEEMDRPGGAGVYYHFDYVGGPRSYKWLNVTPVTKIWEQMHLAYEYEATEIWIVNVGDLKPMEYPIDFFLAMAWDPAAMPYERALDYGVEFATGIFGPEYAGEIAELLDGYARLNRRRTPEMLAPDTLSLVNYREADRVSEEWDELVARAEALEEKLPMEARDAYFQLVLYPVKASATVQQLHIAVGLNRLYAVQGRAAANTQRERANALFAQDQALVDQYHSLGEGRWNHLMAQINLGYTYWQQPPAETMPATQLLRPHASAVPALAIEGSETGWPVWGASAPQLPPLTVYGQETRWIELFNRGSTPFAFTATASHPWLELSMTEGTVEEMVRVNVSADWDAVPLGEHNASVVLEGGGQRFTVTVPVVNPARPRPGDLDGFVEVDRHIAMEAPHYTRAVGDEEVSWMTLDHFGRTLGGVTVMPVRAEDREPGGDGPRLEYDFHTFSGGEAQLIFHLAPSLDFQSGEGLRFAYSIDDGPLETLRLDTWDHWHEAVGNSIRRLTASVDLGKPGKHTLKVWMITPGVVFERILLDFGGIRPSYLGPPETPRF